MFKQDSNTFTSLNDVLKDKSFSLYINKKRNLLESLDFNDEDLIIGKTDLMYAVYDFLHKPKLV